MSSAKQIIQKKFDEVLEMSRKFLTNGEYIQAIESFKKLIFIYPENADCYFELADIYVKICDYSFAVQVLRKGLLIKNDPVQQTKLEKLLLISGSQLLQNDKFQFDFSQDNKQALCQFNRAMAYQIVGYRQLAIETLDQCINLDPDYYQAIIQKARCMYRLQRNYEAIQLMWKAQSIRSYEPEIVEFVKKILPQTEKKLDEAKKAVLENDYSKALNSIQLGLQMYPKHTKLLILKAFIHRKQGYFESALNDLEYAHQNTSDQSQQSEIKHQIGLTYNEMAMLLFQLKKFEEAKTIFAEALLFKQNDWGIYVNKGDCHFFIKQYDQSLRDYFSALESHKQNNKNEPGMDKINQRIFQVFTQLGIQSFNRKDYKKALEEFTRAINFEPNNPQIYTYRGKCLNEMGVFYEAQQDFKKALQIDPNFEEVKKLIKQ